MSIIVFCEHHEEGFKKYTLEAITYGRKLAESTNQPLVGIVNHSSFDKEALKRYGLSTVYSFSGIPNGDSRQTALNIASIYKEAGGNIIILPFNSSGKILRDNLEHFVRPEWSLL